MLIENFNGSQRRVLAFADAEVLRDSRMIKFCMADNLVVVTDLAMVRQKLASVKPHALVFIPGNEKLQHQKVFDAVTRLRKVINITPIFCFNSDFHSYVDLISDCTVYAVERGFPTWVSLNGAIERWYHHLQYGKNRTAIRDLVQGKCLVKKIGLPGVVQARLVDMSPQGMKVRAEASPIGWGQGDEVNFSITAISASKLECHIEGMATVRWSNTIVGPTKESSALLMGLKFEAMNPKFRVGLTAMLNNWRLTDSSDAFKSAG